MSLSTTVPPSGRKWIPYLKRAEELDNQYPLVSFYCRLYVAESLMAARQQAGYDKALDGTLVSLLDVCEKEKAQLGQALEDGPRKLEDFCISVFGHADNEDRSGEITSATSMKFYVASLFFDVLEGVQVDDKGTLPPDLEEKRKYAKFKAVYINKCLKEGSTPQPGPPGSSETSESTAAPQPPKASAPSSGPRGAFHYSDDGPATSTTGVPSDESTTAAPASTSATSGSFNYAVSLNSSGATTVEAPPGEKGGQEAVSGRPERSGMNSHESAAVPQKRPTPTQMQEAKKKCHHAASAIDFDDRATAIKLLTEAIALLQGRGGS
ncbi:Vacuolar protein sorting-associated protein vta1 [Perkinsus olseni]|uniref:Vacuolar protein sorting-associated protein vta1 n=1 Tax=Perkinsus olseni TaxID=32597 RepID=A0A7J6PF99_PEROL|nr:Vacuolar protein sorting-associated protein vta1 [Perkinsus olseni]KAF4694894.1 Vacuolar protein sorting-associated protein vta1 [Perkinsus olseni]KAF4697513.1 Vacuolar protein sorting-associated protein vta1, variant 2 [Perkinsus olseni]